MCVVAGSVSAVSLPGAQIYALGSRLGLCGRGSPGPPLRRLGEGLGASPSGDQASTGTALGLRLGAHSAGYKPPPNTFYLTWTNAFVHVSVTAQEKVEANF